jgi:hypothetical protein
MFTLFLERKIANLSWWAGGRNQGAILSLHVRDRETK